MSYKRVSFSELCRMCAQFTNPDKRIQILRGVGKEMNVQFKMEQLLGIKVKSADRLPKLICSDCVLKLEQAYNLREQTIKANELLNTCYKNHETNADFQSTGKIYIKDSDESPLTSVLLPQPADEPKTPKIRLLGPIHITRTKTIDRLQPTVESQQISIEEPKKEFQSRNYVCHTCDKSFKRREHLYQHEKIHLGAKPFQCNTCSRCFKRKEHLLRHCVLHTGLKTFACMECPKTFSRSDNLLKHSRHCHSSLSIHNNNCKSNA